MASWIKRLNKIPVTNVSSIKFAFQKLSDVISNAPIAKQIFKEADLKLGGSTGKQLYIKDLPFAEFRSKVRSNDYAGSFGKVYPDIKPGSQIYRSLSSEMSATAKSLPDAKVNKRFTAVRESRPQSIKDKKVTSAVELEKLVDSNPKTKSLAARLWKKVSSTGTLKFLGVTLTVTGIVGLSSLINYIVNKQKEECGLYAYRNVNQNTTEIKRYKIVNCSCKFKDDVNSKELTPKERQLFESLLGEDYMNDGKNKIDCDVTNNQAICIHGDVDNFEWEQSYNKMYETVSEELDLKCRDPDLWDILQEAIGETLEEITSGIGGCCDFFKNICSQFSCIIMIIVGIIVAIFGFKFISSLSNKNGQVSGQGKYRRLNEDYSYDDYDYNRFRF